MSLLARVLSRTALARLPTAETGQNRFYDDRTGVIESPRFTLEQTSYLSLVSGGENRQKPHMALFDVETGEEIERLTGVNDNRLRKRPGACSP